MDVIIDFYAPYCPSCMQMLPVFENVAGKFKDKVKFLKVDTSESPEIAQYFQVPKVPYILVLKNGEVVHRYPDVMAKRKLIEFVNKFL